MLKKILRFYVRPLFKNYVYTVRNGIAKGLKRKGGLGFVPFIKETEEVKFLKSLDLSGKKVYDVGGYEGVVTIFFANASGEHGKVITFEPNPENYLKILDNVKLNMFMNVDVRQIALGEKAGEATLAFQPSGFSSGSIQDDIKQQIVKRKGVKTIQVPIDTLDHQVENNKLSDPDFVKIDVEGLEMNVLLGMSNIMKRKKPTLFIEIHGADVQKKIDNVRNIVSYLIKNKYSIYHVESKTSNITSKNAEIAKEGHLFCT